VELMVNQSAYDLRITSGDVDVALMLDRPAARGTAGQVGVRRPPVPQSLAYALRSGESYRIQEDISPYRDTSGGAGWNERLAENVYSWGEPSHNRVPSTIMPPGLLEPIPLPATTGSVRAGGELGRDLYVFAGDRAFRLPNGDGAPEFVADLSDSDPFEAFSAVSWGSPPSLYVGGLGGNIWKCNGSTRAWTRSSTVRRKYLSTVYWVRGNIGKTRLVGTNWSGAVIYNWSTSSISYTDNQDPMSEAVWSEEIQVGNPDYSITGLGASNQVLYVLKTNGLHTLDDRLYSPNITAYRQNQHETRNPSKPILVFNGHAYFGSQFRGLERVPIAGGSSLARQDRPQQCNFGFGLPNTSPIGGEATALCNDNGWLAQTYQNRATGHSYLVYGIDYADIGLSSPGIGGPLLHHGAEAVLPNCRIDWLYWHAPAGTNDTFLPQLLLGGVSSQTGNAVLYRLSLPELGNPMQDLLLGGGMRFAEEWVCTFPRDTWGTEGGIKDLTRVTVRGERLGEAALAAYGAMDGAAFGDPFGTSRTTYDTFPIDAASAARDWAFRVRGTGSPTNPAIFKALEAQAHVWVEPATVTTYSIVAGAGTYDHNGIEDTRDPYLIEGELIELAGKRVTVRTPRGDEVPGRVLQQNLVISWEEMPSGERTGRIVATIPVMLDAIGGVRWDSGRSWDSFARWG
jgi:hypothetical protein